MYLTDMSAYMNGLTDMASSLSERMLHSDMQVFCFPLEDCLTEINEYFPERIRPGDLEQTEKTLKEVLGEWLGSDQPESLTKLTALLERCAGSALEIYTVAELSDVTERFSGKNGPYYTTEDLFVCCFEEAAALFIRGNFN